MALLRRKNNKTVAEMRAEAAKKKAAEAVDAALNAEELLAEVLSRMETLEAQGSKEEK